MATQDIGGLLFGQGGSGLEEYLTAAQQKQIQQQGMMSAAAALLAASGERPVGQGIGLGQALGGALQAGQQGYQTAQQGAIANLMAKQKMAEYARTMKAQEQVAKILGQTPVAPQGAPITPDQAISAGGMPVGPTVQRAALIGQPTAVPAQAPEEVKFGQYMKIADMYTSLGKGEEAKRYMDMAYQIKPREEITGQPFEVTDSKTNKPIMVQQFKSGRIQTMNGFGPKRDITLQDLGGRVVAVDKSKVDVGTSYNKTLAPQVVGGAESGYYAFGGGGGAAPAPAAGGQRTVTPPVGSTIMRPDYRPAPSAAAGQVVPPAIAGSVIQPRATGLQPIIAGTGAKPPAEFMKASKQLNDLEGALKDYKTEIAADKWVSPKNIPLPFSETGIPLPTGADTARVAGKYNSLLMGVKNLYELGALTGPDMSIIERQLTNPASWAGLLTSKNAMNEQVKILEDMLARAKENLSGSYRQTVPAASTAGMVTELVWDPVLQKAVPKQ
jgi:hypothetical protein